MGTPDNFIDIDMKFNDYNKEGLVQNKSQWCVIIKKNDPNWTKNGVLHICRKFIDVQGVFEYASGAPITVHTNTLNDAIALCRGLKSTNYEFDVRIVNKLQKQENPEDEKVLTHGSLFNEMLEDSSKDLELPAKQYQRPQIESSPLLPIGLHNKYFNITDDAHDLERENLHTEVIDDSYKYNTGRAYNVISAITKTYVQEKVNNSDGMYDQEKNVYISSEFELLNSSCSKVNTCAKCQRDCDAVCACCDNYYCNVKCQSLAHHSKLDEKDVVSLEKPAAVTDPGKKLVDGIKQMPSSGSIVTITAVCKTNIVFIRSKNFDDNMEYFKTVDGLQRMGSSLQSLASDAEVNVGDFVVVNYAHEYHRAMIMARNESKVMVYLIDYGNLFYTLISSSLYRMPLEYANVPKLARAVVLKNVPDCYMHQNIREFMYSYLHNIDVVVKYNEADWNPETEMYSVELIDDKYHQCLNEVMIMLAKPEPLKNLKVITYYYDFEMKSLPLGENVQLVVMDTSCLLKSKSIFCTISIYALQIEKFYKDLQNYGNSLSQYVYTPRPDEMCLIRCGPKNEWLRGVCVNAFGDGYPVIHFIDYGCTMRVSIENIRMYPYELDFPIYTHCCEIDIPSDITTEMKAQIDDILPNGVSISCTCEYLTVENCYKLELPIRSTFGCLKLANGSLIVERSPPKL